jgi:RNA polymerase sigma-70 factor (ECF subfamily)
MTTAATASTARPGVQEAAVSKYDADFSAAYESHYTKLFAFVYSRMRDVELSKDIVAQVFERAYSKGHGLRQQAAYGAWLFMIAKNLIAGHYRKNQREYNHLDRARDELRFADGPPSPEEAILRDERVGQLLKQIATLPRRDQELLSLKFDAELTNAEIAHVLKMTPLNVRVAVFRALKRLRSRMLADDSRQAA